MASLSFFHLRAIFYGANIGLYYITQKKRRYFFSHRNEFQDHFYPHTTKTLTSASHCSAANRAPSEARRRSGSGRSARAGQAESQRGEIAEPPLRSLARRSSDRKKEEQTAQSLGIFSTYRGAFHPSPPPRSTPTPTQEARAEKPTKKLSHARTTPSFCFLPSPIGSNSMVHNTLRMKISNILIHRKQPTTTSASTPCR